ncbi:hypothetical protein ACKKBG_A32255 [Auxenochlorella protothecoides x Auxenochlorella symbiontica]
MSSTLNYALVREPRLLDIVDDEWAAETLPDDDIELPAGLKDLSDSGELGEAGVPPEPQGWDELALSSLN